MLHSRLWGVCAFAVLLAVSTSANAAIVLFDANFDGLQVVPPNASPAFGTATASLDDVSGAFTITAGSYQDLLGGATSVILSDAAAGSNGPLLFALTLDTPGATTGTFSGGGALTAGQVADMLAGNTYIRIASQVFPGGEIRGQLVAAAVAPEPASLVVWSMLGFSIGGACWWRRKRYA